MKKVISFEKNPNAKPENDWEKYLLLINGEKQTYIGQYLGGEKYEKTITVSEKGMQACLEVLASDGEEFPFKIHRFIYNGFFGREFADFMKEKGRFIRWSGDPGIAVMMLDNGKEIKVPTFAIPAHALIPIDGTYNQGILFGSPSKS